MLELRNVSVTCGKQNILRDVSFSAEKGKFTALIGKNGSGKSTIVSCINRIMPYRGRIIIDEKDISSMSMRERACTVAVMPQILASPHITVEELVSFGRNPYIGIGERFSEKDAIMVEKAMRDVKIYDLKRKHVNCLSGGERQKVFFAMILAQDTPVIVLDEPTAYMDMEYEGIFLEMLCSIKKERNRTLLVIMHDLTDAVRYADNIVMLDNGKTVFAGDTHECIENGMIEKVFGIKKYVSCENGERRIFFTS